MKMKKRALWIDESTGTFLYSYRLSAVFFLPAENGCRGESRAAVSMSAIQRAELLLSPVCGVSSPEGFCPSSTVSLLPSAEVDVCSSLPSSAVPAAGFLLHLFVAAYGTFFMLQRLPWQSLPCPLPTQTYGRLHSVSRRTHRYSNGCFHQNASLCHRGYAPFHQPRHIPARKFRRLLSAYR